MHGLCNGLLLINMSKLFSLRWRNMQPRASGKLHMYWGIHRDILLGMQGELLRSELHRVLTLHATWNVQSRVYRQLQL